MFCLIFLCWLLLYPRFSNANNLWIMCTTSVRIRKLLQYYYYILPFYVIYIYSRMQIIRINSFHTSFAFKKIPRIYTATRIEVVVWVSTYLVLISYKWSIVRKLHFAGQSNVTHSISFTPMVFRTRMNIWYWYFKDKPFLKIVHFFYDVIKI